jgi:hypothetical protein
VTSAVGAAFVAPDGRSFSDRAEYRRYLFDNFYTFAGRKGETLTKAPGEIGGQMFVLRDLADCVVRLCDASETVQMDRLVRCRVLVAASCESVFMRNCVDCTFTIGCKQLRTRDCERCLTYLYAKTDPIIEKSYAMEFLPFNAAYAGLDGTCLAVVHRTCKHVLLVIPLSTSQRIFRRLGWSRATTTGDAYLTSLPMTLCCPDRIGRLQARQNAFSRGCELVLVCEHCCFASHLA